MAVSYNDNYGNNKITERNYLSTIRLINYLTGKYVKDINGWYNTLDTNCLTNQNTEIAICYGISQDMSNPISRLSTFNLTNGI